jgi:ElaB/YqjD/DUF883 family membrane-anchored ribosome-binding protein
MTTQATVNPQNSSGVTDALKTAGKIADVALDFGLLKKRLENAVEDAILDTERMAKHGRRALEDVMEDTTYWIKKNPWQSVGYAAGAGLGIGLFVGWFTSQLSTRCDH